MRTEKEVADEIALVAGTEDREKLKQLLLELNLIVLGFTYRGKEGYVREMLVIVEPNGDETTLY